MSWSTIPPWALLSLATNGILMLTVILLIVRAESSSSDLQNLSELQGNGSSAIENASGSENAGTEPQLGPRHQWNYEQWLAQLQREADAIAANPPERLGILAGDSISLWFPPELLPPQRTWLNQGISGEVSSGLLKRLPLFDNSNPEVIFVMIGINDLIRGISPSEVVENQRAIVRDLIWVHPNARIVVQSILPHSGADATWEGRDRLLTIPNDRIRDINRELAAIASEEGVEFLDLYPLFADSQGKLRLDLTTDGVHLNEQGYLVWRTALMVFDPS